MLVNIHTFINLMNVIYNNLAMPLHCRFIKYIHSTFDSNVSKAFRHTYVTHSAQKSLWNKSWLVPLAINIQHRRSREVLALSATFTSVLFIYSHLSMPDGILVLNFDAQISVSVWCPSLSITCSLSANSTVQYIPINMDTVLLCFALLWLCNRS